MPASRIRYACLATERANSRSRDLDRMTAGAIAALMNREDRRAVAAVGRVRREIAAAVTLIVGALRNGGRLFFVGLLLLSLLFSKRKAAASCVIAV